MFDMEIPDSYLVTNRVYNAHRDIHNALNNFIKVSSNDMLYDLSLIHISIRSIRTVCSYFNIYNYVRYDGKG